MLAADAPGRADGDEMLDPRIIDATGDLVPTVGMSDEDIGDVVETMRSLRNWHLASERMSVASRRHMRLNATDMRAIRYLIAAANTGSSATPGMLADHLAISSAATTKMLDRLEHGGHVIRMAHPTDRRAIVVSVTEETRRDARETVGRQHARRFAVAAAMTTQDRAIVRAFLEALSATEDVELDTTHDVR